MNFDLNKKEIVYHTTNHRDSRLEELATLCSNTNRRMVLIIPTIQKYPIEIQECFEKLGNDLLIYEINMGMGNVLKSRAEKYVQYVDSAELYE